MNGDYDNAINSYRLAIKLNPNSAECHFNLASAFNDKGDEENAIIHYSEASKYDSENIQTFLNLAKL